MEYKCKWCNKDCKSKMSWLNHERLCKNNPNRQLTHFSDFKWQKQKGTNQFIKAKKLGIQIESKCKGRIGPWLGRKHTEATKQKISLALSLNNKGGKCKWFKYNNTFLQGTWELNIAKKLDEFNIFWIKSKLKEYTKKYTDDDNKKHTYNPDFYLKDYNCFLEIKGYWWGKDKRKMELVLEQNKDLYIIIIEKDIYEKLLISKTKNEFLKLLGL